MIIEARDADFANLLKGVGPQGQRLAPGGLETHEVIEMLRGLAQTIGLEFAPCAWIMVRDGEAVGLCSMVRAPAAGVIEIGYGVAASRRGRGIATEGVAAVVAWARADVRVKAIHAETSVNNPASQGVLSRNGFAATGQRLDDHDGEVIGWRLRVR